VVEAMDKMPPRIAEPIEIMIRQQREFCEWWTEIVSPGQSPGTNQWSVSDLIPTTTAFKAEQETGISKMQVSRWKSALADEDSYHEKIYLAACRKAGIEPAENHRAAVNTLIPRSWGSIQRSPPLRWTALCHHRQNSRAL
jgi:hypothetical protein